MATIIADLIEEAAFEDQQPISHAVFATLVETAEFVDDSAALVIPPPLVETAELDDALDGHNYSVLTETAVLVSEVSSAGGFTLDLLEAGKLADALDAAVAPPALVETAEFDDAITGEVTTKGQHDLVEVAALSSQTDILGVSINDLTETAVFGDSLDHSARADLLEAAQVDDLIDHVFVRRQDLLEEAVFDTVIDDRYVFRADLTETGEFATTVDSLFERQADLLERGYLLGTVEQTRVGGRPPPETGPEIPYGTGGIGYAAPVSTWAMSEYRDVQPSELGTDFGLGQAGVYERVPRGATGLVSTGNSLLFEGRRTQTYISYLELETVWPLSMRVNVSEGPYGKQEYVYKLNVPQESQDFLRQPIGKRLRGRRWTFTVYGKDFKLMRIQLGSKPRIT